MRRMRRMRRFLALTLALLMAASLFPQQTWAGENVQIETAATLTENEAAAENDAVAENETENTVDAESAETDAESTAETDKAEIGADKAAEEEVQESDADENAEAANKKNQIFEASEDDTSEVGEAENEDGNEDPEAEEDEDWSFNLDKYRADILLEDYHQRDVLNEFVNVYDPPAVTLVDGLKSNTTFQKELKEWETANIASGESVELTEETDLCYTILMNIIQDGVESEHQATSIVDTGKKNCKEVNKKWMKEVVEWGKDLIKGDDAEEEGDSSSDEGLEDYFLDWTIDKLSDKGIEVLENCFPALKAADKAAALIDQANTTVNDYLNLCSTFETLAEYDDGITAMLDTLVEQCGDGDTALKQAIEKIKYNMTASRADYLAQVMQDLVKSKTKISTNVFKTEETLRTDGVAAMGGLSDSELLKFGISAHKFTFRTDKKEAAYKDLIVYDDIMDKIRLGMVKVMAQYDSAPSLETAAEFLNMFHLFFSGGIRGCEYAKDYTDVLNDAKIENIVFDLSTDGGYTNSLKRFTQSCDNMKKQYEQEYQFLSSDVWRCQLQIDYPKLYEQFANTEDASWSNGASTAVTAVNLTMTNITWNINFKSLYLVPQFTPVNATNRLVRYTSSDTSILTVTANGRVTPLKKGRVKVTCTSMDGNCTTYTYITISDGDIIFNYNYNTYKVPVTDELTTLSDKTPVILTEGSLDNAESEEVPETFIAGGTEYKVTAIGDSAFKGKTRLTYLTIPDSVTEIGSSAFSGCSMLENLPWSGYSKLEKIGSSACKGCKNMAEDLYLPDSLTKIESYAFDGCTKLTGAVTIPENVGKIGEGVFRDAASITSLHFNSNMSVVPNEICSGDSSLSSVTFDAELTSVGNYAFEDCESLVSIYWDCMKNVTSIGESAFQGCLVLNQPDWSKLASVKSLGNCCFKNCKKFTSAVIPKGVTSLNGTFSGCSSLETVQWPDKLSGIGTSAFYGCHLTSLTLPASLGLVSIANNAFDGGLADSVTKVTVPEGIYYLGKRAFAGNTGLTSVSLPASLTQMNGEGFSGCTSLKTVIFNCRNIGIGASEFYGCQSLASLKVYGHINGIGDSAFYGCSSLKSFPYLTSLVVVGSQAFMDSGITSIKFPATLKKIGSSALWYCSNLKTVYFYGACPTGLDYWLIESAARSRVTVHYPKEDSSYKTQLSKLTIKADLTKNTVSVANLAYYFSNKAEYDYTGSAITPSCSVRYGSLTGNYGYTTLKNGTDYKVTYKNNVDAGTATMTITGIGSYGGSVSTTFKILGKNVTASDVTLKSANLTCTGKTLKPVVTVKYQKSTLSAANYTVSYYSGSTKITSPKNVGLYTVKVQLKGIYCGSISKTFRILPKGTAISKLTSVSKGCKVTWKKQATQTTGYQIQYSTSSKFASAKTMTVKKNSITAGKISKLTAKKKYYVRIRTYKTVGKTKYYSGWSAVKTVTAK